MSKTTIFAHEHPPDRPEISSVNPARPRALVYGWPRGVPRGPTTEIQLYVAQLDGRLRNLADGSVDTLDVQNVQYFQLPSHLLPGELVRYDGRVYEVGAVRGDGGVILAGFSGGGVAESIDIPASGSNGLIRCNAEGDELRWCGSCEGFATRRRNAADAIWFWVCDRNSLHQAVA